MVWSQCQSQSLPCTFIPSFRFDQIALLSPCIRKMIHRVQGEGMIGSYSNQIRYNTKIKDKDKNRDGGEGFGQGFMSSGKDNIYSRDTTCRDTHKSKTAEPMNRDQFNLWKVCARIPLMLVRTFPLSAPDAFPVSSM